MAITPRGRRSSLATSSNSQATASTVTRLRSSVSTSAVNSPSASAARTPSKTQSRTNSNKSSPSGRPKTRYSITSTKAADVTKAAYADPIVISDSENEASLSDSSRDQLISSAASSPTTSTPGTSLAEQATVESPTSSASVVGHYSSNQFIHGTQDRSYATSSSSDRQLSSDSTLSALSSTDEDSASEGHHEEVRRSPLRANRALGASQPRFASMRASEEAKGEAGRSTSSTPTPTRRSARIVTSGSSIQKALQRRDELDAKLLASPTKRKQEYSQVPTPRKRGRPRKSAPDASRPQPSLTAGPIKVPSSSSMAALQSSPNSSARRSSRLSLPPKLTTETERAERPKRGRPRSSLAPAVDTQERVSVRSAVALPATLPNSGERSNHADAKANTDITKEASSTPVKRGRGRPRRSLNYASYSAAASSSSSANLNSTFVATRLRKRSLSMTSSAAESTPRVATPAEPPRRKRGRPRKHPVVSKTELTSEVPSRTAEPVTMSRDISQISSLTTQDHLDLLDDVSELSDVSDDWMDSPGPSQTTPGQLGSSRRGRPPSAASAERRRLKRATKQDKDGKTYHMVGLYAGEADAIPSTSSVARADTPNTIFPAPIHFGAKLLDEERDFCLPYPIHKNVEELRERVNAKRRPPRYQQISKNKYVSRPKLHGEVPLCSCTPGSNCGNDCMNRMMQFICDQKSCPNGADCTNVRLGKRPAIKTAVAYYGRRGFGLKTLEPIKANEFIDEYRGEVINLLEAAKRVTEEYKATGNYYLLDYDSAAGELLDGGRKGNITRFANHSCDPNCRIEKFIICGTDEALSAEFEIGLFALRDIAAGEELTYNYGWSAFQPRDITGAPTAQVPHEQCLCGAVNCSGILGGKKPANKPGHDVSAKAGKVDKRKGKGKGKRGPKKDGPKARARLGAVAPMVSAARMSSAALPTASLLTTAGGMASRKIQDAQSKLASKIVIKRQQRVAGKSSSETAPSSAADADDVITQDVEEDKRRRGRRSQSGASQRDSVQQQASSSLLANAAQTAPNSAVSSAAATSQMSVSRETSASASAKAPNQAGEVSPARTASSALSAARTIAKLPLLNKLARSKIGSSFGSSTSAARGTKQRRWSAAAALESDNDEPSQPASASDSDSVSSDFQEQDEGPQPHPALSNSAGKTGRRGRHKLQLSAEEAERRASDRRARNAFLARVRRASKRGIVIEDPTQHPLKKISIQCTAAPENTYIPDLPSSLVTLGMTTADARRARNAFLARVRRAVKRGHPKDVAIKMAAKPLPGDAARDTPVMKAQRMYMEQLEREAADETSGFWGINDQKDQGTRASGRSQQASGSQDGWEDETAWTSTNQ